MKKIFILVLFVVCGIAASELFKNLNGDAAVNAATPSKTESASGEKAKYPEFANVFSTESSFADAKEDLLAAISAEGLVISYTSHAKTMLENTAEIAGVTTPVYDDAEILLFCKANLSHALVGANPHNIVLCPYAIAIYVLHDEPETVYLSFREPDPRAPETKEIKALLVSIIEEVI
ncbi:hypothetical protein GCM10009133_13330 [Cocleimonas flava]|uniref:DUF302 domain-containing protein n=1 Tax=Cocleimonas flava TaxID=634765 RepID=A0A4R1F2N0_9GAMM|nr:MULTISPECIES: hypothetical protein [Cocleimonas]MEB8432952.1 hypothetical protein [Cocleimonas sp. KMM 6892]MEC4716067.1 hypothetical protein [Cocleimonas sp. KMM 6895]MEC4745528.1 hypothetical protein [Cocleimonas sp. KMM 6896]TCJ87700.1 hypothetical protein EV695_2213 [Cocleimonas flava]